MDDPVGSALAINRLGVIYFKLKKFDKSLKFHIKHEEYADRDNVYASCYNIALCYRFLRQNEQSIIYFKKSLDYVRDDKQSLAITYGQLGVSYLITK